MIIETGKKGRKAGVRPTFTVDRGFRHHLAGYDLARIGASPDTVYVMDGRFRLRGFNASYRKTAERLGGRAWMRGYGLGFPVLEGFTGFYSEHYRKVYSRCLRDGEPHSSVYGCASPKAFLWYRESVKPLREGFGLIVTHHRLRTVKRSEAPSFDQLAHLSPDGLVLQCCHCDRVRNYTLKAVWEWVPDLPEEPEVEKSHGLCPHCLETYYQDLMPAVEPD